jgi:hypothetical protein
MQLEIVFPDYGTKHQQILQKLEEKRKILRWLINGYGKIGLPLSAVSVLTKEWVVKNYNVEMSYFTN